MNLNRTLRYIVIGAVFLIPFISLIVSTSLFFPYITGKNFAFRILVEIMFACWAVLAFRDPAYRPKWKSPIVISLLAFIGVLFVADIFGEYFFKSFWSNFERMEGLVTFLHLAVFFFATTTVLNTEKLWRWLFHTSVGVSLVMGFIGIYQHFHDKIDRVDARLGNSTYLGAFMLFHIFILLFYLMRTIKERSVSRWPYLAGGYGLLMIFDAYILFITGTRGAFLGVLGGFIFIAVIFAFFEKQQKAIRNVGIALLVLIVVGIGSIALLKNTQFIKSNPLLSRFSAPVNAVLTLDFAKFAETEGKGRLLIWQAAIKGFKERPILGWGEENFNYVFNKYYSPEMYTQEQWFDRSHNVILDWLTAGGLLGLLSYLSLFGALIYSVWKRKNNNFSVEDKAVLIGLFIAYFIHNLFVFDNITSYILFFLVLAYANRTQYENETLEVPRKSWTIHPDIATYALAPIVILISLAALYFSVVQPYQVSADIIKALRAEGAGNAVTTLASFQSAVASHTLGTPEAREQLITALPSVAAANIDPKVKQDFISLATTQMLQQLKDTPSDARYFLFYGYALDRLGDLKQGQTYLEKASELSPGKQTIIFELGLNLLAQGEIEKSLALLKQAYDSAPAFDEARITYAMGLIYANKGADAEALLEGTSLAVSGDNRIIKAYYDTKQYGKAIDIYHLRQVANPNDAQAYLGAAGFYVVANQKNQAIAELQHLIDVLRQLSTGAASTSQYAQNITTVQGFITQIQEGKNPLPIQ